MLLMHIGKPENLLTDFCWLFSKKYLTENIVSDIDGIILMSDGTMLRFEENGIYFYAPV